MPTKQTIRRFNKPQLIGSIVRGAKILSKSDIKLAQRRYGVGSPKYKYYYNVEVKITKHEAEKESKRTKEESSSS